MKKQYLKTLLEIENCNFEIACGLMTIQASNMDGIVPEIFDNSTTIAKLIKNDE